MEDGIARAVMRSNGMGLGDGITGAVMRCTGMGMGIKEGITRAA